MGRTAVVAGTATAVSNRVSRRQYNRWADQDAAAYQEQAPAPAPEQAAPAAQSDSPDDRYAQLEQLAKLKEQGILTDEEFAAEKAKILNS
jgi:hypothetical protein